MLQMTNDNDNAFDADDYDDMLLWCIVTMGVARYCIWGQVKQTVGVARRTSRISHSQDVGQVPLSGLETVSRTVS